MTKKLEEICSNEHLAVLSTFRIVQRTKKVKAKHHKFISKMVKRARLLGLLPFTHLNLYT